MQIREAAQHFAKAGINIRPKALQSVSEFIKKYLQHKHEQSADVEMQDENNPVAWNDSSDSFESEQIINFVIKKFEDMKAFGSETSTAFLEVSTVNKILECYNAQTSTVHDNESTSKTVRPAFKSLKDSLKHAEDVIMEEKNKDVSDSIFKMLSQRVIVLDSFADIPTPSILGAHIKYSLNQNK